MRRCFAALLLILAGCSSAPLPAAAPPQPEPEPAFRSIIAAQMAELFSKDAQMHAVSISGGRRITTPVGEDWRVCLRGTSNSAIGGSTVRTYAIIINKRSEVVDRRLARPDDGCDQERYAALGPA